MIAFDRRVRAVRRAERIVDVARRRARRALRERRIVLFFFGMEAEVLEQDDVAGSGACRPRLPSSPTQSSAKVDRLAEQLRRAERPPAAG